MLAAPQKIAEANKHPLNQAALAHLKEAQVSNPETADLHLLALASWGLEQGARPVESRHSPERSAGQQLGLMLAWEPQNVLKWLVGAVWNVVENAVMASPVG